MRLVLVGKSLRSCSSRRINVLTVEISSPMAVFIPGILIAS